MVVVFIVGGLAWLPNVVMVGAWGWGWLFGFTRVGGGGRVRGGGGLVHSLGLVGLSGLLPSAGCCWVGLLGVW